MKIDAAEVGGGHTFLGLAGVLELQPFLRTPGCQGGPFVGSLQSGDTETKELLHCAQTVAATAAYG